MFKTKRQSCILPIYSPNQKSINGFLLAETLLALFICMISGYLLIGSLSALSKTMKLSVQPTMESSDD